MNTTLTTRLTNLTNHLTELTTSITSYNPSPAAASALLTEDQHLTHDLETLAHHQSNHATLLRLRQTTRALDDQIKAGLRGLAETRKELIAQRPRDGGDGAEGVKGVDVHDLLNTARRIARYTRPPARNDRRAAVKRPRSPDQPQTQTSEPQQRQQQQSNPSTSLSASMNANTQTTELATQTQLDPISAVDLAQQAGDANQPQRDPKTGEAEGDTPLTPTTRTRERLPEDIQAWVEPPRTGDGSTIWTPWPNENVIRAGALGRLQWMVENRVDVAGGEQTERKDGEEERMGIMEARNDSVGGPSAVGERRGGVADEGAWQRQQDEAHQRAEEEKQKQEEAMDEFDLYDPDE